MIGIERSWKGCLVATAMSIGLALATSAVVAATAPEVVERALVAPSAKSLMRFYPAQLGSTPAGTVEDQEVWMAKVQGLMASAPSFLQQSMLNSQNKQEFSANIMLLEQLQTGSMKQAGLNMRAQTKTGAVATKALGDSSNLVYKALPSCRIMDTRFASGASGVQGPIIGNNEYFIPGFVTAGTDWSQYGQTSPLSDCGLNSVYGGSIYAIALVVTILNPNFDAYLGVDYSNTLTTTLTHVALNFTRGQGLSTMYIVPQIVNTISFAMPTGLSAQLVFDVVGFFHLSDATALDCLSTSEVSSTVLAGANWSFNATACPATYTRVSYGCRVDQFGAAQFTNNGITPFSGADCQATNVTGASHAMFASSRCCRVPGR